MFCIKMKVVVGKTSFKNSRKTKWKQCELALRNIIYIIFFIQSLVTKLLLFLISKSSFELLLQNSEKFQYFLIFFLETLKQKQSLLNFGRRGYAMILLRFSLVVVGTRERHKKILSKQKHQRLKDLHLMGLILSLH